MGCTPLIPAVSRWQIADQTFPSYLPSFPECIINKHALIATTVPVLEPPVSCGFRSSGLGMGTWSRALCQPHSVGTPGCSPSLLLCPWWGKIHLEARICSSSHESGGPGTGGSPGATLPACLQTSLSCTDPCRASRAAHQQSPALQVSLPPATAFSISAQASELTRATQEHPTIEVPLQCSWVPAAATHKRSCCSCLRAAAGGRARGCSITPDHSTVSCCSW